MPDSAARAQVLQRLRVLIKLMLGVAFVAVIYVALSTGSSKSGKDDSLPSMRVNLGDIPSGSAIQLLWQGRPVIVLHRTAAQIKALDEYSAYLRDAASQRSTQPLSARNATRSVSPEWFVALATGTDLGCSLDYIPDQQRIGQLTLHGLLKDTCRGSVYDLAGRVLSDQQAQKNLRIPNYVIDDGELILGAQ